jgi:hypothetical protein
VDEEAEDREGNDGGEDGGEDAGHDDQSPVNAERLLSSSKPAAAALSRRSG